MKRRWLPTVAAFILGASVGSWLMEMRQPQALAQPPATSPTPPSSPDPQVEEQVEASEPSDESPLLTLDWLIGSWTEAKEVGEATRGIHFTCQFTKKNAFILRSFTVGSDDNEMSGMQVIAWDPSAATIRSWTFDSDGGFGQEDWSQAGDRYTIRKRYTLPDGAKASSLNVLTYVNENQFTWRSVQREVDGELQPDIETITLVRTNEASPATVSDSGAPGAPADNSKDATQGGEK